MEQKQKFYQKTWFMWVMMFFLAPVGIFLMWKYKKFGKVVRVIMTVVFGLFFLVWVLGGSGDNKTTNSDSESSSNTVLESKKEEENSKNQEELKEKQKAEEKAKVEAEEKAKKEAEEKAREEAEMKAIKDPMNVNWNTEELDAMESGNIHKAAEFLTKVTSEEFRSMPIVDTTFGQVLKAPWKYYGKVIPLSGEVSMIQEYPPGGEISEAFANGGEICEIHGLTDDDTAFLLFFIGSSGDLKEGDYINLAVLPTGQFENSNAMGGIVNELVVVGK